MDGSDKPLSSSTLTKQPVTPKPSASDENDQYYQQVGKSSLQSPKKPMAKNYMSPTISAASKAIASKKNILGERNEASEPDFFNTRVKISPTAIDNANDSLSRASPLTPSFFQSHNDGEALSDSLTSRPYDPVTNYLSPRPQFLRYKPNRCKELFLGLENGVGEGNRGLSFSRSGSFDKEVGAVTTPSSLASPHLKQEGEEDDVSDEEFKGSDKVVEGSDEEIEETDEIIEGSDEDIEESDEEYEEVEEEKGWNLKGVLKNLLLWLVLVLFASHISTMNHKTLFEVVEDGYCSIQNNTLEAALMKKLESGGNLWNQTEERQRGLVEVIKGATEIGFVEDIDDGVKDENLGDTEHDDELREVLEVQAEEVEATELTEQEKKGGIDELGELVAPQVEESEEISDQMVENSDLQCAGIQNYQTPSMSDEVDHHNPVSDVSNSFEEKGEVAVEQNDGVVENMRAEAVMAETMDNLDDAEGNNWREELINHMKSKTFYTALVGVSIFSAVVASLVLAFRFKQTNDIKKGSSVIENPSAKRLIIEQKKIIEKVSSPAPPLKPYSEPAIAEKYDLVLPSKGENSIERVYSSFRRMSLSSKHSTEVASEEHCHSQAPSVQLLGEFVVGEVSSSLRSCGMKKKMTESEESNYSVSSKKLESKVNSVSIQAQPSVSEFSSMVSPSHGSYSPRKNMKTKEGGKDGEVTTPLRRSNRLRNQTVMSP